MDFFSNDPGVSSKAQAFIVHLNLHDFNKAFLQTSPLPAPSLTPLFVAHPRSDILFLVNQTLWESQFYQLALTFS